MQCLGRFEQASPDLVSFDATNGWFYVHEEIFSSDIFLDPAPALPGF